MTEFANLSLAVDSRQIEEAEKKLGRLTAEGARTERASLRLVDASKKMGDQAKTATGHIGSLRGSVGQLGYQVQDIAVQLQSGTNPLLVLGQQGSQIASVFGPGGIVVGALLATAAAAGTALVPALFEAETATERLEKALGVLDSVVTRNRKGMLEFTEDLRLLAKRDKDAALLKIQTAQLKGITAINAATAKLREETEELYNLGNSASGRNKTGLEARAQRLAKEYGITREELGKMIEMSRDAFSTKDQDKIAAFNKYLTGIALAGGGATDKFQEFAQTFSDGNQQIADAAEMLEFLKKGFDDTGSAVVATRDLLGELVGRLEDQAATLGLTGRELAIYRANQLGAADADRTRISAAYDLIDSYDAQQEAQQRLNETQRYFGSEVERALYGSLTSSERALQGVREQILTLTMALEEMPERAGEIESALQRLYDKQAMLLQTDVESSAQKMTSFAEVAGRSIRDIFGSNVKSALQGDFDEIGNAWGHMLADMGAKLIASDLLRLGDHLTGGGLSSLFGGSQSSGLSGLLSFDGGGFTGYGPRAGGVDGKGGFLMVGHPNETVLDHTKGQQKSGGGVVVHMTNNIHTTSTKGGTEAAGAIARKLRSAIDSSRRY